MAVGKEIRTQIASIKSTRKITSAMEMVAASKMRKAQDRMARARPYADKMRQVISHLSQAHPEYRHHYTIDREIKSIGYIIISSDRGLCGGLNSNLFRKLIAEIREQHDKGVQVSFCTIGTKAQAFFARFGGDILGQAVHLGDTAKLEDLIGTVKVMLDAFDDGGLDRIDVAYNTFINSMTQQPTIEQLVPIAHAEQEELRHHWDYIYEPDAKDVLDSLLSRYVEALVYHSVIENAACEQSARMVAMKAATDNAGDMIDELELIYNKARQAAITQEISEIVSGAAAV